MKTAVILFSALLMTVGSVFAQGMGQRRQFYDTTTVTTISGVITSVDSVASPRGNNYGLRMSVQDSSGTTTVFIGPASYLASQGFTLGKGDTVQVTGSKVHFNQNDILIAAQIVDGGKTIKLRDDTGKPAWSRDSMR